MRNAILSLSILFGAGLPAAQAAAACSQEAMQSMMDAAHGFGNWREHGSAIEFRWLPERADMAPVAQVALMKQFAMAQACVSGQPRKVVFFMQDKPVATIFADGRYLANNPRYAAAEGGTLEIHADRRAR